MKQSEHLNKRFRRRYYTAFGLIIFLTGIAQFMVSHVVEQNNFYAKVINVAGQQRMLSQKIALHVYQLELDGENNNRPVILSLLQTTLERFEQNLHFLSDKGGSQTEFKYLSDEQVLIYLSGNPSLYDRAQAYYAAAQDVVAGKTLSAGKVALFAPQATEKLLYDFDRAVQSFEAELVAKMQLLNDVEFAIWLITILLLIFVILYIFRPMESVYAETFEGLLAQQRMTEQAKMNTEQAYLVKSRFMASMSHELRTPLSAIFGLIDMSLSETDVKKRNLNLAKAKSSGWRLLKLINDVLELSRIDGNLVEINNSDFSLIKLLDSCLSALHVECEKKGLVFSYTSTNDLPSWVTGDPSKTLQILNHLADNAVKFTEKGSVSVEVSTQTENQKTYFNFIIRDTGIGIAEADLPIIMNRFTQVDNASSRAFGGSGLGLSLCKEVSALMGGNIFVSSKVGVGSEFRVKLPIEIVEERELKRFDGAVKDEARIAVVDDLETSRQYVEDMLKRRGYCVDLFSHGSLLISSKFPVERYTAIVVDIHMPGLDGYELADILQAMHGDHCPPIIAISAALDSIESTRGEKLYMKMLKPLDERRFLDGIDALNTHLAEKKSDKTELKILVAEDEDINAEILQYLLVKEGHSVTRVKNGLEAVNAVEEQLYDLIIMDINMPDMDGLQASNIILNERNIKIPIVALTASNTAEDRKLSEEVGITYHLAKPIMRRELVDTLQLITQKMHQ